MHSALGWCAALATIAAGCTDTSSSTDLHPEGPPMIEQVRLTEVTLLPGATVLSEVTVFAFGTHPEANPDEEHAVTAARPTPQKLRIMIDELLRGNNLEEIQCRAMVDDDVFASVPVGATPDDIARCTVAQDVLPRRCPGSDRLSVCICQNEGGCSNGNALVPKGESVGVEDVNQDGAADHTRFIAGAVGLSCDGIDVAIDQAQSYWTPSGNQQKPAQGGFDALGPAIVLVPGASLPTGKQCGLVFSPDVVDKDGIAVCAPPDGDIAAGCAPGDVSAFTFTVEALRFTSSLSPTVPRRRKDDILIVANAALDPASVANVTMTEDPGTSFTQFTATVTDREARVITVHPTAADGFAPNTRYTITVPTTVTDAYHLSAPAALELSFVTATN